MFVQLSGFGIECVIATLQNIGPAVLNGGITTFLAVFLLYFSDYYAYVAFFKVFALAVFFGLFHGLLLLPTMLIAFGSKKPREATKNYHT